MARSRVLSFMSALGPKSSPTSSPSSQSKPYPQPDRLDTPSRDFSTPDRDTLTPSPTPPAVRAERSPSRPVSMGYQPPFMDHPRETLPELLPIFSFLSSHANKLYQEGYFLKLNDLDTNGKPNADRNWTECFAQLVGTVLSLWDAAALDVAGQDGEIAPTFINLADASIKMIETLPTRNQAVKPLQNVLSISTAGKNRYLLHFNSLHSLTQWTAGIRLAMFEHASLQELYTGSLIAGKGKLLNNIRTIMERTKTRTEDWVRVRFGAGTPWRRCWCVIDPPDEKDFQKRQKSLKKKSAYERPTVMKGDIKFYDTKKSKKAMPIATITDAYSAYAIYPQSKPLVDQSTLVKVEGRITIHSNPESKTEGFVFVMPEVHPAVTGFEMMLRWLFPVYDTFNMYGRPQRLIADTLDPRGLMFAMPRERRYGYLEIIDVAGLIHEDGSQNWSEREWRKRMKEVTSRRMASATSRAHTSRSGSRKAPQNGHSAHNGRLKYDDTGSIRSLASIGHRPTQSTDAVFALPPNTGSAPPGGPFPPPAANYHARSASETSGFPPPTRRRNEPYQTSRLSMEGDYEVSDAPPAPPAHHRPYGMGSPHEPEAKMWSNGLNSDRRQIALNGTKELGKDLRPMTPPAPVADPPIFAHQASDTPQMRPNPRDDLRRANSRISNSTLSQMVDAAKMGGMNGEYAVAGATAAWQNGEGGYDEHQGSRGVNETPIQPGVTADHDFASQGMAPRSLEMKDAVSATPNQASTEDGTPSSTHNSQDGLHMFRVPQPPAWDTEKDAAAAQSRPASIPFFANIPSGNPGVARERLRASPDIYRYDAYGEDEDPSTFTDMEATIFERLDLIVRPGVLKTVGNPELSDNKPQLPSIDIPIDFGPTKILNSVGIRQSSTPSNPNAKQQTSPPDSSKEHSAATASQNRKRALPLDMANPLSPSQLHGQVDGEIWQPGTVIGARAPSPGPRLTPEEFVQQRAITSRNTAPYAPQKSYSSSNIPMARPTSGDWAKPLPPRPHPRSASPILAQPHEYSSRLSAREQEQVARMTGMPLVSIPQRTQTSPVGLVGTIDALELEKKTMRNEASGQIVQKAIAQQSKARTRQSALVADGRRTPQPDFKPRSGSYYAAATSGLRQQAISPGRNPQTRNSWGGGPTPHYQSRPYSQNYDSYHGQQNAWQRP